MKINASLVVLLATALFPATLVTTYGLALYNHHVMAFWPYISHTGNHPVESCFFSFGLNVVAGLYILIVHLRYQICDISDLSSRLLTTCSGPQVRAGAISPAEGEQTKRLEQIRRSHRNCVVGGSQHDLQFPAEARSGDSRGFRHRLQLLRPGIFLAPDRVLAHVSEAGVAAPAGPADRPVLREHRRPHGGPVPLRLLHPRAPVVHGQHYRMGRPRSRGHQHLPRRLLLRVDRVPLQQPLHRLLLRRVQEHLLRDRQDPRDVNHPFSPRRLRPRTK